MDPALPISAAPSINTPQVALADLMLDQFRRRVIDGRLAAGTLLPEAKLARELGVSRVPVREALAQLREDGLAIAAPHGRTRVAPIRPDDLREIVTLRLALERLAVGETVQSATTDDLVRLRRLAEAGRDVADLAELARLDVEFHQALVEAAGHRRLFESWRAIKWPYHRWLTETYRTHRLATLKAVRASMSQHLELVGHLERRNVDAALKTLTAHINEWGDWLPAGSATPPPSPAPRSRRDA